MASAAAAPTSTAATSSTSPTPSPLKAVLVHHNDDKCSAAPRAAAWKMCMAANVAVPVASSERFDYYLPAKQRDADIVAMYHDEATMKASLPMLYGMTDDQILARRDTQRASAMAGTAYLEIIHRTTGELAGAAGFREVLREGGEVTAEFGVAIWKKWQRKGVCREAFWSNVAWAAAALGCTRVTGATLPTNAAMLGFFAQAGLKPTGHKHLSTFEGTELEWVEHAATVEELLSSRKLPMPDTGGMQTDDGCGGSTCTGEAWSCTTLAKAALDTSIRVGIFVPVSEVTKEQAAHALLVDRSSGAVLPASVTDTGAVTIPAGSTAYVRQAAAQQRHALAASSVLAIVHGL